jgi:cytochrome oxidase Cu insertion factor (SCO1/SenC/PrrC family)
MPGPDAAIPDLGPQLFALLLRCLLWAAVGAFVFGASISLLSRRVPAVARWREILLTAPTTRRSEPPARAFLRVSLGLLWIATGLLQAQPKMPAGFVPEVLGPASDSAPPWFGDLIGPLARAWERHPVSADTATVTVQVGLGLLLIFGRRGRLARVALWLSIGWSAAVWIFGEAFGGLLYAGASWLTGAPGAVLVYAAAASVLLAPWERWDRGTAQLIARRFTAVWLGIGAVLQALPFEEQWTQDGISEPFRTAAGEPQPALLVRPIARLATVATGHPAAVNATLIVLLAVTAVSLWVSGRTFVVVAGLALCALTWWLGQDFGVFGGTATDPNSALPLAVLLVCALPVLATHQASVRTESLRIVRMRNIPVGVTAALASLALGLTLVVPNVLASRMGGRADAAAVAADSNGGVRAIPPRPAPPFTLTDQRGQQVSMPALRGKLVLLTFLDPVCTSDCPLIGNQLAIADSQLGPLAQQVEIVAIDTNPTFHLVTDVQAFTDSHGLGGLTNWHFLCGPPDRLQDVLSAYGISVDVPAVGMIEHSEGMYFIGADGRQLAYLDDGAAAQLTRTYAEQVRDEIRSLLK